MIDTKDKATVDAFAAPRRKGRPPSGNAMTPAKRKAAQRRRDFTALCTDLNAIDFRGASITSLLEYLPKAISAGRVMAVEAISQELVVRAQENSDRQESLPVASKIL